MGINFFRENKAKRFLNWILIIAIIYIIFFRPQINDLLFQDFITLFLSIIVEAFPFVVLGVLISIFVALFIKSETIFKYISKNPVVANMQISLLGTFMPVCECGNVPVARRFLMKNFTVSQTITFLLAAPIVNPITIYSTIAAFGFNINVVLIRVFGALLIANLTALIFIFLNDRKKLLREDFIEYCEVHGDHSHKHTLKDVFTEGSDIFRDEFIQIMKMLILGSFIAAISQTLIPRDVIVSIGNNGVLSIIAMMSLAFVISICSNVDAFFALAYVNSFTIGSIISFLLFGPMIDIKMLSMLKSTFTTRTLLIVSLSVALLSFIIGLLANLIL